MSSKNSLGQKAETFVAIHLQDKGFRIIERNVRSRHGEIDIVAEDNGVICFVEVRSRRTNRFGEPADSVDQRKQRKLRQLALDYLGRRRLHAPARFDVASVVWPVDGQAELVYITNAFE